MSFTPVSSLLGGALIGLSASALLVLDGRVAGISGIVRGVLQPRRGDVAWRVAFLVGLVLGGLLLTSQLPQAVTPRFTRVPTVLLVFAGFLVGFGTQLGGGCTSGQGVCGVSRGSRRSIVAVLIFMTTGALATFARGDLSLVFGGTRHHLSAGEGILSDRSVPHECRNEAIKPLQM